jgi:hypothetical protein
VGLSRVGCGKREVGRKKEEGGREGGGRRREETE